MVVIWNLQAQTGSGGGHPSSVAAGAQSTRWSVVGLLLSNVPVTNEPPDRRPSCVAVWPEQTLVASVLLAQ